MKAGLDVLIENPMIAIDWGRCAAVTHASTVTASGRSCAAGLLDIFESLPEISKHLAHQTAAHTPPLNPGNQKFPVLQCVYGPQHGYWQCEPYNMFETPHDVVDLVTQTGQRHSLPLYSLYGESREPDPAHLQDVDTLIVDLPDIGCRVYTYMTTLAGCLNQAAKLGKRVVVLDRPNPLGLFCKDDSGAISSGPSNQRLMKGVEGNILRPELRSFVGWFKIPMRHGLTLGELGNFYIQQEKLTVNYSVLKVHGLTRSLLSSQDAHEFAEFQANLPRMASPNMPGGRTFSYFPITVTLEGTNISEGRGTTSPFQSVGAPFIDENDLCDKINLSFQLLKIKTSLYWRPHRFMPLFDKFPGQICKGVFLDRNESQAQLPHSVFAESIALLAALCMSAGTKMKWREKGYEYNFTDDALDLILGDSRWRKPLEILLSCQNDTTVFNTAFSSLAELLTQSHIEAQKFATESEPCLLYS